MRKKIGGVVVVWVSYFLTSRELEELKISLCSWLDTYNFNLKSWFSRNWQNYLLSSQNQIHIVSLFHSCMGLSVVYKVDEQLL